MALYICRIHGFEYIQLVSGPNPVLCADHTCNFVVKECGMIQSVNSNVCSGGRLVLSFEVDCGLYFVVIVVFRFYITGIKVGPQNGAKQGKPATVK